jgi:hypothetical protein
MPRLAFPNALKEIDGMTEAVTQSDLDWHYFARFGGCSNRKQWLHLGQYRCWGS